MRHRLRIGVEIAIIVLIAGLALAVWPTALGGSTTLTVVHGNSMRGTLDNGDLAIVRSADSYDVGDIIAYRIPKGQVATGRVIIHRIVDVNDKGFVTRGDNRDADDAWFPTASDVVGRVVAQVPIPAGDLFWRILPWSFGALIGGGLIMLLWPRTPATSLAAVVTSLGSAAHDDEACAWELRWLDDAHTTGPTWAPPLPGSSTPAPPPVPSVGALLRDLDALSCSV